VWTFYKKRRRNSSPITFGYKFPKLISTRDDRQQKGGRPKVSNLVFGRLHGPGLYVLAARQIKLSLLDQLRQSFENTEISKLLNFLRKILKFTRKFFKFPKKLQRKKLNIEK